MHDDRVAVVERILGEFARTFDADARFAMEDRIADLAMAIVQALADSGAELPTRDYGKIADAS
jgi:hypothetical protein